FSHDEPQPPCELLSGSSRYASKASRKRLRRIPHGRRCACDFFRRCAREIHPWFGRSGRQQKFDPGIQSRKRRPGICKTAVAGHGLGEETDYSAVGYAVGLLSRSRWQLGQLLYVSQEPVAKYMFSLPRGTRIPSLLAGSEAL